MLARSSLAIVTGILCVFTAALPAEAQFGIALLGDVDNNGVVNVADRARVNIFWQQGSVVGSTLRDCDMNCSGAVNVADRTYTNLIWRGKLGQNSVSEPCPFR